MFAFVEVSNLSLSAFFVSVLHPSLLHCYYNFQISEKYAMNILTCFSSSFLANAVAASEGSKESKKKFEGCLREEVKSGPRLFKLTSLMYKALSKARQMRTENIARAKQIALESATLCFSAVQKSQGKALSDALYDIITKKVQGEGDIEFFLEEKVPGGVIFNAVEDCLGKGFVEDVESPEIALIDEIEEWEKCAKEVSRGGLLWSESIEEVTKVFVHCYPIINSGIATNFVVRSMYAPQIKRCINSGIDESKVFIVDYAQFRENPQGVMNDIHSFIGVDSYDYGDLIDDAAVLNKIANKFPALKQMGWGVDGATDAMSDLLEEALKDFFVPFNKILFSMLKQGNMMGARELSYNERGNPVSADI